MKKNKSILLFILVLYLLVFQGVIQNYISFFKYFDEILSLLVFPVILLKYRNKSSIKKRDFYLTSLLLIILFIGLLSNIIFKIQPLNVAVEDLILFFKFFLVYFLSGMLWKQNTLEDNKNKILFHLKTITYLLFFFTITNYIFKFWPSEMRFGLMTNKIFYSHPTQLAAVCMFLIGMFFLIDKKTKIKSKEIIILSLILISTLRFKAIGAMLLNVMIIIYVTKTKRKITFTKIGIAALILAVFAWDQISYYYIDIDDSARNKLTVMSFQIAKDYFPIGTGFGTYGSYTSGQYYSSLYYKYNLSNFFGLSKKDPAFLTDTFWPMVIGQFGLIGVICYLFILLLIFKNINNDFNSKNINIYISKMICFCYLIISSTSESAFVNPMAIPLALVLGFNTNSKEMSENGK